MSLNAKRKEDLGDFLLAERHLRDPWLSNHGYSIRFWYRFQWRRAGFWI